MTDDKIVALVHLLDVPYHIDKSYEYFIPLHLRGQITKGCFVIVPFGGGNTKQPAVVTDTAERGEYPTEKLKPILSPFNTADNIILSGELLKLCQYVKEYTFCSIGDVVKTILPAAVFTKYNEIYSISAELPHTPSKSITPDMLILYNYIKDSGRASLSRIISDNGNKITKAINKSLEAGLIKCELEFSLTKTKTESYAALNAGETAEVRLGAKQREVIEYLSYNGRTETSLLKDLLNVSQQTIKSLADKNIITVETIDIFRNPYADLQIRAEAENILTAEQTGAFEKIKRLYETGEPKAVLLHGVTGSGKTRVIKQMIDEVLASGRNVIMLVPEIALTPQAVILFKSYYGDRVAVVHSSLSAGERYDAWRMMKNGEVDICIGTRSAIFAPFDNLGMIVIDEEQEHTYKSDMTPKYHARDIARFRCAEQKAMMLLSSATPSVESYGKAESGQYTLVELNERYGGALLPQTIMADLRTDAREGNISPVGAVLRAEIEKNLRNNEQTILFLNRRGYNNYVYCPVCGNVIMCGHCSVSMTYHGGNRMFGTDGHLQCHYCGDIEEKPKACSECGNEHLNFLGYGTQKVEEELRAIFPESRIMRMDADTTSAKHSFDRMLEQFRRHEADILLGTQMVTKGHDFPKVSLVGVISADMSLYVSDYRANERTFALITQVIGRAGRADIPGRAVIQTYNPEHPILLMAADQYYKEFYDNEIAFRRALTFPPYCDFTVISFSSETENEVLSAIKKFARRLNDLKNSTYKDTALVIFGPFEAPVYKVNERYRMRVIVKCKMNLKTRNLFKELMKEFNESTYKKISINIDVNPTSI